jgi:hypothetical protein
VRISAMNLCLALWVLVAGIGAPCLARGETQAKPEGAAVGTQVSDVGAGAPAARTGESGLRVEEIVVCAAVKDRVATGVADTFPSDIYGLNCFTKVTGARDVTAIKHVWYRGETVAAEARLAVKGSPWRTWSYKAMRDDWKGPWKVDVVSPDGSVIASRKFYLR